MLTCSGPPAVEKILNEASSTTNFAWSKYMSTHDAVLVSGLPCCICWCHAFTKLASISALVSCAFMLGAAAILPEASDHCTAQGHPMYHRAYKGSMDTVSSFQELALVQKAKTDLYPSVAPYVDPAIEKISHNSYYTAGVDHLKPVQSNGKLT